MQQAVFGDAQALSTFLTVEGFLLATVSLAVTLGAPRKGRVAKMLVPASVIALSAASLSILVGVAAAASWVGLFGEGTLLPLRQLVVAVVLLLALVAQPVIAVLLALGARHED